jgi:hypothetical protein
MWTNTDHAVLATIDAIKSICEVLIANKVVTTEQLGKCFDHQGAEYIRKRNPDGAAVMMLLLQYLGCREEAERLAKAVPRGTA